MKLKLANTKGKEEKKMKKALFMIAITLFLATTIAHGNSLGKIYTTWTITIDIKPEQTTHQIAMNDHEIKIETIYNPYFDFRTNRIRLSLDSEIYIDGIQVWKGYPGSKVKCTALKTGDVMIVVDEKKIWPSKKYEEFYHGTSQGAPQGAGDDYYEEIPQKACSSSYARSDSKATATANYGTWLILGKKYVLLTREKIYPCVISKDDTLECTAEGRQKLQTNVNIVLGEMEHDRRQVDFDSKVTYLSHMVGIPVK